MNTHITTNLDGMWYAVLDVILAGSLGIAPVLGPFPTEEAADQAAQQVTKEGR